MSRIEHNMLFEQSVEVVFPYLATPEVYPQWQKGSLDTQITSEGPIGVGTTFRAVYEIAGRRVVMENKVTAYEPNKKFAFNSISDNLPNSGVINLQPAGEGARAHLVYEAQLGGFFRLAEPLAARLMQQQQQADLEELKKLLEDKSGGNAQVHE